MSRPKSSSKSFFLSGWKDIANHLSRGVRTAQRYEIELGLPIRRPAGKEKGSVLATTAELDAWVHASPLRKSFVLHGARSDSNSSVKNLKSALAEHHRLHEEMAALRVELQIAFELLRANLLAMQAAQNDKCTPRSGMLLPFESGKRRLN